MAKDVDTTGSAYGRPPAHFNEDLAAVGPGTPWANCCAATGIRLRFANVADLPRKVTILGEDLVLFRDRRGRAGLLYPRCMHRGTSLTTAGSRSEGIRCCYHGWLFDVEGHCLDQPCEPDGGRHRDAARQPWYPVEERYGLVFAYLGPPREKAGAAALRQSSRTSAPDESCWSTLGGFGCDRRRRASRSCPTAGCT